MSIITKLQFHAFRWLALLVLLFAAQGVQAQNFNNNNGVNSAVGGVSISPEGILRQPTAADFKLRRDELLKLATQSPAELNAETELRLISLRHLNETLAKFANRSIHELPAEVRYLAGIQRFTHLFVFPEERDIVLAGPGEGWKVNDAGNVVGVTTGRPVVHLEDLMVAMRTVDSARKGGVTCSIDPTAEGRRRLDAFLAKQTTFNPAVTAGIENALGEQVITLTGVPETSRFARTMVAADYRMKRYAMQLEKSPIANMPSFVEMVVKGNARIDNMMPRWWLACDYEPLGKSADGLAWEIRGRGVKVMTEDELIGADGSVKQTGKANPVAQKWSDTMTARYEELSVKDNVFGDLRNIMDLSLIAALIAKEQLESKAMVELSRIVYAKNEIQESVFPAPKKIDTQCTAMKRGREWVITASGGVDIQSWEMASKSVVDDRVDVRRTQAQNRPEDRLIWNAR